MQYQYLDRDYTGTSSGSETEPWKQASGTDGFVDGNSGTWADDLTVYVKGVTNYLETTAWDLGADKCTMNGHTLTVLPWGASQYASVDGKSTSKYTIDGQIHLEQPGVTFIGLQMSYTGAGSETYPFVVRARNYTGTCRLFRCRIEDVPPALNNCRTVQIASGTGVVLDVEECIIAGNASGTSNQGYGVYDISGSNTLNVRNCIVEGWNRGTRDCNIENSAVFNNFTDDNYTPNSEDYVASDDGNGTNPVSPSGADWDNEFVAYGTGNYTVVETGNCFAGGKDLSAYYTVDLSGETIVNDSIGVDDFASGASRSLDSVTGTIAPNESNTANCTGLDTNPTTQIVTLGGEACTITNWNSGSPIYTIPADIDLKWGVATYQLAVTDDTGTVTLNNQTLLDQTGWDSVDYDGPAPGASEEGFVKAALDDLTITMEVGADQVKLTETINMTVGGDLVITIVPPDTKTGSYAIWDDSAGAWSTVSSFTFAEEPTLTSPGLTSTGQTTMDLSATTDVDTGTLYWYLSQSATPPSTVDLKAGTGSDDFGSIAISTSGAKADSATGLTASTTYYLHALHTNTVDSSIVTSAGVATDAAGSSEDSTRSVVISAEASVTSSVII